MQPNRETLLCRYHYDPLDRLAASTPTTRGNLQRFYQKDRLATEIFGAMQRSIMQHDDQLLAQHQRQSGTVETCLLATDQQRSVLNGLAANHPYPLTYTPYGHRPPESGLLSLIGFNGEQPDPVTEHYLLGNGYRAFNPVLMRFNSPDSWSPFGKGGLNAYAYCEGEPISRSDSTGRSWGLIKANLKLIGGMDRRSQPGLSTAAHHNPKSGLMTNIRRIGKEAFSFEDIHKGKRRLNFSAHGEETAIDTASRIGVNGEVWNAEQLYLDSIKRGIDFNQIDNIRVLACFSGHGGSSSLGLS